MIYMLSINLLDPFVISSILSCWYFIIWDRVFIIKMVYFLFNLKQLQNKYFKRNYLLRYTNKNFHDIYSLILNLEKQFTSENYNSINNNCNHFCNTFIFLSVSKNTGLY